MIDAVIHLRTPPVDVGHNHDNPLRLESAAEALAIDDRIALAWQAHPRRFVVEPTTDFLTKAQRALALLREELPTCCSRHPIPPLDSSVEKADANP